MKLGYLIVGLVLIVFIAGCAEKAVTPPAEEEITPPAEEEITPPAEEEITPPAEEAAPAAKADIVLKGMAGFEPSEVTVSIGSSVTVLVQDKAAGHRITVVGTSDRSPVLTNGQTYEFVFEKAGTYKLYDTAYKKYATVIVK